MVAFTKIFGGIIILFRLKTLLRALPMMPGRTLPFPLLGISLITTPALAFFGNSVSLDRVSANWTRLNRRLSCTSCASGIRKYLPSRQPVPMGRLPPFKAKLNTKNPLLRTAPTKPSVLMNCNPESSY